MKNLDDACTFLKELARNYKVASRLEVMPDGSFRIDVPKSAVSSFDANLIVVDAITRGFKDQSTDVLISFSG